MLAFIILPSYYMERKSKDAALISTELKQWHRENTESLYYVDTATSCAWRSCFYCHRTI